MKKLLPFFLVFLSICTNAQESLADKIFINAKIWTADPSNEYASSIAI